MKKAKKIIIGIFVSLHLIQNSFSNTHNFSSDTTLTINSDETYNSITTTNTNEGIIDFAGVNNTLTIENNIGTEEKRVKELQLSLDNNQNIIINSQNSGTAFFGNINIFQSPSSALNQKQISGSIILNSDNLNISQKSQINNQSVIGNIIFNQNVDSTFNNLSVFGNISGNGKILSTQNGIISFTGENTQTITNTQLGDEANPSATSGDDDENDRYINKIAINNSSDTTIGTNAVTFDNSNIFVKDIEFSNDQEDTKLFLNNSSILNLSGNISHINENIENFYILDDASSSEIKLSGTAEQNINVNIGQDTNRFNKINITNPLISFSKKLYLNNLEINQDPDIGNSIVYINSTSTDSVLDLARLNLNNNLTLRGEGKTNIQDIDFSNNQILTLEKDINITGNIDNSLASTTDKILSSNNKITLNGASIQTINTQLGESNNRINQLENYNQNQISITENSYIQDISFSNASGGVIGIATGKEIDISGNITAINQSNSIITGSGTVNINGTQNQTISSKLGTDSSNKLSNLIVNNNNTTIDNNTTSYLSDLTLNADSFSIKSGTILDINNSSEINLSNKTINYIISSNNDTKLISQNAGINTNNSIINIDYSLVTTNLNNTTQTIIDNTNTTKTINDNQITLTDNSYLLTPRITTISANKELRLTHSLDSNIFNSNNLGSQNYEITNYLVNDLGIYNIYSLRNEEDFQKFSESVIIPKNNSSFKNNINLAQNINSIIDQKFLSTVNKKTKNVLWGDVFSNITNHKKDSKNHSGYDSKNTGLIFGYMANINQNNDINYSTFYNNSKIENKNETQEDSINSIGFSINHKFHKKDKSGYFNYNKLYFVYNLLDSQRNIYLENEERKAKADTSGYTANISTGIGYNINQNEIINFVPRIEYQYHQDNINSYQETGAENLSLKVEDQNYVAHKLKTGFDLYSAQELTDKESYFIYEPKLSLFFTKKLAGTKNSKTKISFVNQNKEFEIEMPDINDDYLSLNASIDIYKKDKMPKFSIMYNGILSKDIISNSGSINLKYEF